MKIKKDRYGERKKEMKREKEREREKDRERERQRGESGFSQYRLSCKGDVTLY